MVSNKKIFDSDNCFTAKSLDEAIQMAGNKDIYISDGARLYQEALPIVENMYVTEIDAEIPFTYVTYTGN